MASDKSISGVNSVMKSNAKAQAAKKFKKRAEELRKRREQKMKELGLR
jgi:hypothetical protein